LLCVDRKAIGIIEAKKVGTLLSGVAEQSAQYAESLPDFMEAVVSGRLPFVYESTGAQTFFTDYRDPDPRARDVFAFHRPSNTLAIDESCSWSIAVTWAGKRASALK
jgi:type I restriction enzyme R subunit